MVYSVRSAYRWLRQDNDDSMPTNDWSWIWKYKVPANRQFFCWQVSHEALPMRSLLANRGINISKTCSLCNVSEEDFSHCFFGCDRAKEVWRLSFPGGVQIPSFSDNTLK